MLKLSYHQTKIYMCKKKTGLVMMIRYPICSRFLRVIVIGRPNPKTEEILTLWLVSLITVDVVRCKIFKNNQFETSAFGFGRLLLPVFLMVQDLDHCFNRKKNEVISQLYHSFQTNKRIQLDCFLDPIFLYKIL